MPEIEFVETLPPVLDEPDQPAPRPESWRVLLGVVPALLALGAAALAAWAPFRSLVELVEPSNDADVISTDPSGNGPVATVRLRFDGWGRVRSSPSDPSLGGEHGVHYGVVACLGGGLFVLAALLIVGVVLRGRGVWAARLMATARGLLIAGAAVVVAYAVTAYLAYLPFRDEFSGQSPAALPRGFRLSIGWSWLVAALSAVVGLIALAASGVIARITAPTAQVAPEPHDPEPHDSQPLQMPPVYGLQIEPLGEQP